MHIRPAWSLTFAPMHSGPGIAESCPPGAVGLNEPGRSGGTTSAASSRLVARGEVTDSVTGHLLRPNPTAHLTGVGRNPFDAHCPALFRPRAPDRSARRHHAHVHAGHALRGRPGPGTRRP